MTTAPANPPTPSSAAATAPPPPLVVQIPPGDAGTLHALAAMRAAADRLADRPELRALAATIAAPTDPPLRRAAAVFDYMQNAYRFIPDPRAAELLRDHAAQVQALIDYPRSPALGDCDDRAVLTAALCQALGLQTRFVVVSSAAGKRWHHVFTAATVAAPTTAPHRYTGSTLIPLDSQVCAQPGAWPPGVQRWHIENDTPPAELL